MTKSGKVNENGAYVKLALSQGTLMLNKTALDNSINRAFGKAAPNSSNCSLSVAATGQLPFISGTGRYAGASGTAHITVAVGFILPHKNGKCDTSDSATPTASRGSGAGLSQLDVTPEEPPPWVGAEGVPTSSRRLAR